MDAVYEYIPAVKIQIACYEPTTPWPGGLQKDRAIRQIKDLLVIGDIKRNDIGSTAKAYASAYLGQTQLKNGAVRVLMWILQR